MKKVARLLPKYSELKFDYTFLQENLELYQQNCKIRQPNAQPKSVLELKEAYRRQLHEIERIRREKNMHADKIPTDPSLLDDHRSKGKAIKQKLLQFEEDLRTTENRLVEETLNLPNLTHPLTPVNENEILIEEKIDKKYDSSLNFQEIAKKHNLWVNKDPYVYFINQAAHLELALVHWAINKLLSKGFTPVITPDIIRTPIASSFEVSDKVLLENKSQCLVNSSEIAIAAMFASKSIESLPRKVVGTSHCFFPTEQFPMKVKQGTLVNAYVLSSPQDSEIVFEEVVSIQKEMMQDLEIPFRVSNVSARNLPVSAYSQYSLQGLVPSLGFIEIGKATHYNNYQSLRLSITSPDKKLVHTVGATLFSVPSLMASLLELGYNDAKISFPACLVSYLDISN